MCSISSNNIKYSLDENEMALRVVIKRGWHEYGMCESEVSASLLESD